MYKQIIAVVLALLVLVTFAHAENSRMCMVRCRRSELSMRFCKSFCGTKVNMIIYLIYNYILIISQTPVIININEYIKYLL